MAKPMRLDKFLCEQRIGTRSEVKSICKKGLITVNGNVIKQSDCKINPDADRVCYQGNKLSYQEFYYYMLHKPAGVITATQDGMHQTVLDLLKEVFREDLFPVGRLDKDTEGLLLITNDGALSHELLSPRKHVPKTYLVEVPEALTKEQIGLLEQGVDIGDEKLTMPANVQILDEKHIHLTISEGRFHQVKRMLLAVGSEVLYLKRISFGGLNLDKSLEKGQYRALIEQEVAVLKDRT